MINMFVNVTNRTSTAIESLQVDALNKQAIVTFSGGDTYAYVLPSVNVTIACLFKASTCKDSIAVDVRLVTFKNMLIIVR